MTAQDAAETDRAPGLRVLITATSAHGATIQIAQAIGQVLSEQGFAVTILPPENVHAVETTTRSSLAARST